MDRYPKDSRLNPVPPINDSAHRIRKVRNVLNATWNLCMTVTRELYTANRLRLASVTDI